LAAHRNAAALLAVVQAVHELGHAVGAWITGGQVVRMVLHPGTISRTDVEPNPHPLVWAGPLVGVFFFFFTWALFAAAKLPASFLRLLAGFCLIANGAYIGLGSFRKIGDCGVILRNGSPLWLLWLFGIVTIPAGLCLLDGTRDYFGFGAAGMLNSLRTSVVTTIGLMILAMFEFLLSTS